jgi:DNA-binding response OmpR family regulator
MTILIADDNQALCDTLQISLAKEGHAVHTAADGNVAMKLAETCDADILLTDIIMPEREGLETILSFRRRFPKMKIIAMSGHVLTKDCDETHLLKMAKVLGAHATIAKPFTISELLGLIQQVRQAS